MVDLIVFQNCFLPDSNDKFHSNLCLLRFEPANKSKNPDKWYEIAHLPVKFQEGCDESTATYALNDDGNISVLNESIKSGKVKQARATAKVVDKESGAKLKVSFF